MTETDYPQHAPWVIPRKKFDMIPLCPLCKGRVYWSSYYSYSSSEDISDGIASCSNNSTATRTFTSFDDIITCEWRGFFRRKDDGHVTIYSEDGKKVPYRILKYG